MPPIDIHRLQQLFDAALALPPDARQGFVEAQCNSDEERRELEALLAADAGAHTRIAGVVPPALARLGTATEEAVVGQRIGPWLVSGVLGRGGMGTVYLAERVDGDFKQLAALKLLHYAGPAGELHARLVAGRRILAALQHPGIARLLDGGTWHGAPWLAMERIEGVHIDRWCEGRPLAERLRVFREVCEAVQYAHRNLVVHRDIKPSNILVDAQGHAHLLDFDIAKLLDDPQDGERTQTQARLLTPDYASPEQQLGMPITTASDVYSLGALLYRLLAGVSPRYASAASESALARASAGAEPMQPSLATGDAEAARALRGDLDAIVMMAMRPAPQARYASADALAEDIERHLQLQPVTARREGARYVLGKFVRRHRGALTATAAALLTGLTMIAYYTWQLEQRRAEAELERSRAQTVADFMIGLVTRADPDNAQAGTTLQQVVEQGTARADSELRDQPLVAARLYEALSDAWVGLGDDDRAAQMAGHARALYEAALGIDSVPALRARLTWIHRSQSNWEMPRSLKEVSDVLALSERRHGADALISTAARLERVYVQSNKDAVDTEALAELAQVDKALDAGADADSAYAARLRSSYERTACDAYSIAQQHRRAIEICRTTAQRAHAAGDASAERSAQLHLASAAFEAGQARLAREAGERALTMARAAYGADSPQLEFYVGALLFACRTQGDYACMARYAPLQQRPSPKDSTSNQRINYFIALLVQFELYVAARDIEHAQAVAAEFRWIAEHRDYLPQVTMNDVLEASSLLARLRGERQRLVDDARELLRLELDERGEGEGRTLSRHILLAKALALNGEREAAREQLATLHAQAGERYADDDADHAELLLTEALAEGTPDKAREALAMLQRLGIENLQAIETLQTLADLLPAGGSEAAALRAQADALIGKARAAATALHARPAA